MGKEESLNRIEKSMDNHDSIWNDGYSAAMETVREVIDYEIAVWTDFRNSKTCSQDSQSATLQGLNVTWANGRIDALKWLRLWLKEVRD